MKAWKKNKPPRANIQQKGNPAYYTYRQCQRKRKYKTEAEAQDTLEYCEELRGKKLYLYRCPTCSNFHLTHKSTENGLFYEKST